MARIVTWSFVVIYVSLKEISTCGSRLIYSYAIFFLNNDNSGTRSLLLATTTLVGLKCTAHNQAHKGVRRYPDVWRCIYAARLDSATHPHKTKNHRPQPSTLHFKRIGGIRRCLLHRELVQSSILAYLPLCYTNAIFKFKRDVARVDDCTAHKLKFGGAIGCRSYSVALRVGSGIPKSDKLMCRPTVVGVHMHTWASSELTLIPLLEAVKIRCTLSPRHYSAARLYIIWTVHTCILGIQKLIAYFSQ